MTSSEEDLSFCTICSLLDKLENLRNQYHAPATKLSKVTFRARQTKTLHQWTDYYRAKILKDSQSTLAVLSLLSPDLRRERIYTMKEYALAAVVGRALGMGDTGVNRLRNWRLMDGDFGVALEKEIKKRYICEEVNSLSAVQVDQSLDRLSQRVKLEEVSDRVIRQVLEKCTPSQAKWFARIILKSFPQDLVPRRQVCSAIHPSLWKLWQMNSDFVSISTSFHNVGPEDIGPQMGVPIQIPSCYKAHGCRHACVMMAKHAASCYVETKYDGQRMQIHINLQLPLDQQVQVFSKSRKNSTLAREGIIPTIRKALGIGKNQRFREKCILDAELVLWDEDQQKIQECHQLSNYLLNLNHDANRHVNLMAVFFDVLVLDEQVLLQEPYTKRTSFLESLVTPEPGKAILAQRFHLFLHPLESAINALEFAFSNAIVLRKEGFMIKPANAPYIEHHNWVKLKKDYIPGLGDTLDFCLVGGGFSAERARQAGKSFGTKWNVWHVGCLENKRDVIEKNLQPRFAVLFEASYDLSKEDSMLLTCRTTRVENYSEGAKAAGFEISTVFPDVSPIDVILSEPVLVELKGAGFYVPRGADDYVLRFPRIEKVHLDRDWKGGVTREELQSVARKAVSAAESGEMERWKDALGVIDRYHAADGTVAPSSRLGDNVKEELFNGLMDASNGVEMKYGLNIESILERGLALENTRKKRVKRKNEEEKTNKRICLGIRGSGKANQKTNPLELSMMRTTEGNIQHLLSKTVIIATKTHQDEISRCIHHATFFEFADYDANKENEAFSYTQSDDYVVLVDQHNGAAVRKVLAMAKRMSIEGGHWHVYNWKVVRCINGDNTVNPKNEHLWTYIDGHAY